VVDQTNPGVAMSNISEETMTGVEQGYQFVYLSNLLGITAIPVFGVTTGGTGLNLELAAITGDTPIITLNLAKVG
jgi:hypothetical protein